MAPLNPAPLSPLVPPPVVMTVPLVPVAPHVPPVPAELDEDEDEDEYADVDDGAIECVNPMPKASPSSMQVTSARADK